MYLNHEDILSMRCRLESIFGQGVELYLNGTLTSPAGIVDSFVNEDTVYMPDFVINEEGILIQIRYDRVDDCHKLSKINSNE